MLCVSRLIRFCTNLYCSGSSSGLIRESTERKRPDFDAELMDCFRVVGRVKEIPHHLKGFMELEAQDLYETRRAGAPRLTLISWDRSLRQQHPFRPGAQRPARRDAKPAAPPIPEWDRTNPQSCRLQALRCCSWPTMTSVDGGVKRICASRSPCESPLAIHVKLLDFFLFSDIRKDPGGLHRPKHRA